MQRLVIIRHGQSEWTNRFTGWTDIDIAPEGIEMTKKYALRLKENNFIFDIGYASVLKRSIKTLQIVLKVLNQDKIQIVKDEHLNERSYGDLQGQNKAEAVDMYGEDQVAQWRRSYNVRPPNGESLEDTYNRVIPYFTSVIAPQIKDGKRVIISGHSNSIRALVKYFDKLSDDEIVGVDIPYCIPLIYEFDENLNHIKHYYLADEKEVRLAVESIKNQVKKV